MFSVPRPVLLPSRPITKAEAPLNKPKELSKSAVLGKMHRLKIKQGHKVNSVRYKKNDNMGSPLGATHKMQTYFPKHGEGNCNICNKKFTKYSKFDLFCSSKCRNYYGYS